MDEPGVSIVMSGPPENLHIAESPFVMALNFLRKDSEYRATFTQKQITESTRILESVNSAVLVATFVAGVQAQIIALTADKNDTKIQVAANAFGFLGLVFDILGANQGVIHAVKLKKSISEAQTPLGHVFMDTEQLDHIQETLGDASTEKQETQRLLGESLLKEISESKKFWTFRRTLFTPRDPEFKKHLSLLFPTDGGGAKYWIMQLGVELDESSRRSTLSSIRLGVFFLLISVLCFAGYSQPHAVWITCVVVTIVFQASFTWGEVVSSILHPLYEGPVVQNLEQASGILAIVNGTEGVNIYVKMVVSIWKNILENLF